MGCVFRIGTVVACAIGALGWAQAADLSSPPPPAPPPAATIDPNTLYDPQKFEIRGGGLASFHKPETGDVNLNGEVVLPKFISLPGWQDMLIPRLHIGGMGNVSGGTSYAYAGGLWTVNFGRFFTEVFGGGAIHDGSLTSPDPMPHNQPALGCRELYHIGGNVGYRFDQNWSAMVTVDHISNGRGVLSNCPENTGLSLVGLRIGYSF
jgi:lipid A 3-O-deacylase